MWSLIPIHRRSWLLSSRESAVRQVKGISVNYQGNHENARNMSADIEETENCAYEPFRPVIAVLNPDAHTQPLSSTDLAPLSTTKLMLLPGVALDLVIHLSCFPVAHAARYTVFISSGLILTRDDHIGHDAPGLYRATCHLPVHLPSWAHPTVWSLLASSHRKLSPGRQAVHHAPQTNPNDSRHQQRRRRHDSARRKGHRKLVRAVC